MRKKTNSLCAIQYFIIKFSGNWLTGAVILEHGNPVPMCRHLQKTELQEM
jgi:hypothetical protein